MVHVPPAGVTVAIPVALPLQSTLVVSTAVQVKSSAGSVIVTLQVVVQPLASVTVTLYVPAAKSSRCR